MSLSRISKASFGAALLGLSLHAAPLMAADAPQEENMYEALKRFSQVIELVEKHYVTKTPSKELMDGAIKGMLENLDPHSTFMTPKEYEEMQETTSGEFSGIGIEMTMENGQVKVVSPIEDTPAFRVGLQPGDIILTINGESTQELSLSEVVSRIRGPKGTDVELTIIHTNSNNPETVTITRDSIPLISVKAKELEEGYHWLRITRFSERTTDDLHAALEEAQKSGIKGIVLDMRNNPGGLVNEAVSVSDTFLSGGDIVSIRGRSLRAMSTYRAKKQNSDITVPMVVLVNAGSASASEIVAGALRDHKRALILGEKTFGKGSVQNIIPLADGSGLKLTIALYYTPNGSSIQAEGITPDMEIPFEPVKEEDGKVSSRFIVRERDLSRHIAGKDEKKESKKEKSAKPVETKSEEAKPAAEAAEPLDTSKLKTDVAEQLARDNQLRMALQMVKTLPTIKQITMGE